MPPPLHHILFLDIETVPQFPAFAEVTEEWKELWGRKAGTLTRDKPDETPASVYGRAGIYAEFGKIICISCGILSSGGLRKLSLKSFYGDEEKLLLQEFADMLDRWSVEYDKALCAHNGKEFDFPYLCRRMIVHGIRVPSLLNLSGKKPWEIPHLDTMELWKFGEYKNFTSLNLLAHTLGIPTPKDDIDGSRVAAVYWEQHDLLRIVKYCQKDVITVVQVYLRLNGEPQVKPENIEIKLI
jgi:predicted PolB exonuclease-like 3'-5' exonuclease